MAGVGRPAQTGVPTMIKSYSAGDLFVSAIFVSFPLAASDPPLR
jgi:hypothetical protein